MADGVNGALQHDARRGAGHRDYRDRPLGWRVRIGPANHGHVVRAPSIPARGARRPLLRARDDPIARVVAVRTARHGSHAFGRPGRGEIGAAARLDEAERGERRALARDEGCCEARQRRRQAGPTLVRTSRAKARASACKRFCSIVSVKSIGMTGVPHKEHRPLVRVYQ